MLKGKGRVLVMLVSEGEEGVAASLHRLRDDDGCPDARVSTDHAPINRQDHFVPELRSSAPFGTRLALGKVSGTIPPSIEHLPHLLPHHDLAMDQDHSHHHMPGMPDMDMGSGESCSMSMTFNTSYKNLCLIFPSWRLTTPGSLYLSLSVIVGLCIGYEWLRLVLKRLDRRLVGAARRRGGTSAASAPLLGAAEAGTSRARSATRRYDPKVKRGGGDGAQGLLYM